MIRALLVDDHQIVRSGVRRVLEATGRFDVVGEAGGVGEELADAIDAVLADRIYVHPTIAARLVMRDPEDDLTERERQILRLIALGYTNQEIAGQLFLSVRTIEAHRRHILDKLRLTSRAELVRYALERRIVEVGPA
jgi:two-component system response regulator NreC